VRAIWKGAVSFGLVSIPVKLYTATEEKDVSFHQVHREDGGRIRYKRVCQIDGEEVAYADIAKGYELPSGETVVLTDEDFADLPLTSSRVVDVLSFVPLEQVDPIYFAKSYYLEPEKNATKPYVLLRDALQQADSVALVKVAIRTLEALATLRVRDGVLVLETMVWPDEVRTPDFGFLDEDVTVRPQELAMAESYISALSGDFEPGEFSDNYREALEEHGWDLVDPRATVPGPLEFREYVQGSGAEFSVAQGIYVETNSGWFSDRTVRYLASGRPVLVQDTGFSENLPVGEGLLAFRDLDGAVAGAQRIAADYERHRRAARAIAEAHFDSDTVLARFLEEAGIGS